jgi:hypothetical protein
MDIRCMIVSSDVLEMLKEREFIFESEVIITQFDEDSYILKLHGEKANFEILYIRELTEEEAEDEEDEEEEEFRKSWLKGEEAI